MAMNSLVLSAAAYYWMQLLATPKYMGNIAPEWLLRWLPMLAGLLVYVALANIAQNKAKNATAALIGSAAPDFTMQIKDQPEKSLQEYIKENARPTLIDFYQNFCPACGPAAQQIDKLAADDKYKGRVNFILCNMSSLDDAATFARDKKLKGAALHTSGKPPGEYGIQYIPHKVLIDAAGNVVKNFDVKLPADIDELLKPPNASEESKKED